MRRPSAILQVFLLAGTWLWAQETEKKEEAGPPEPQLPNWEESELEELESGEYVPGSSLMGKLARESLESDKDEMIELTEAERTLPEGAEGTKVDPRVIPEEFLPEYFQNDPKGKYLNDPQELLTSQEKSSLGKFLSYHTQNVGIKFYLYLFDEKQELPVGLDLEASVTSRFDPAEPAAVVFYYLGAPRRSELFFTKRVLEVTEEVERSRVLWLAREEAREKSDPSSQLEEFSTQLSVRLANLEREIREGGRRLFPDDTMLAGGSGLVGEISKQGWLSGLVRNRTIFWCVVGVVVVGLAGLLGWVGRWIALTRRTYVFPDAEGSTLLEAPYAAGVGGVLSFASAQTPPSRQKSDVPDYLQRM